MNSVSQNLCDLDENLQILTVLVCYILSWKLTLKFQAQFFTIFYRCGL